MILNYNSLNTSHPSDCGLCVLGGIVELEKQTLVDKYKARWEGMTYSDIIRTCWMLYADDYVSWIDDKLPQQQSFQSPEYNIFGKPSWENFNNWGDNAKYHLNAGCLGIAQVHGNGDAIGDRKHQFSTNHWVMIKGYEHDEPKYNDEGIRVGEYRRSVYVSCNSRGTYEKEWLEFLMNYGGYNTIWIKPSKIKVGTEK